MGKTSSTCDLQFRRYILFEILWKTVVISWRLPYEIYDTVYSIFLCQTVNHQEIVSGWSETHCIFSMFYLIFPKDLLKLMSSQYTGSWYIFCVRAVHVFERIVDIINAELPFGTYSINWFHTEGYWEIAENMTARDMNSWDRYIRCARNYSYASFIRKVIVISHESVIKKNIEWFF